MTESYRVIQWATGAIGRVCLRQVIDRDDLELVGLRVYSEGKAGRDAGDIARRPATGVPATADVDELLAVNADVVLHTPINGVSLDEHVDDLCRILRSGKNVITTVGHTYPTDPARAELLEKAALDGGVTLFGTGINPGLVAERLALTATTLCTDVRHIMVREIYDCSPVVSPKFIFDLCGFGRSPEEFRSAAEGRERFFAALFGETIGYVADALGVEVAKVESDHEVAIAARDLTLPAGTIPAGTVSCARWRWHAHSDRGRFFTIQMDWAADHDQPGFQDPDGYFVDITGAPEVHMTLTLDDPTDAPDRSKAMQYAVAAPVVNAIPEVCAAPPGILITPRFAPWRSPHR